MRWTTKERTNANLVKISNRKVNVFREHLSNTWMHELAKFIIYWELRKAGHNVIVEAVFEDNQRADIFSITGGFAIEILHSETAEKLAEKDYPVTIIPLKSESVINQKIDYWFI